MVRFKYGISFQEGWDEPPELLIYDTTLSRMYKSIPLDEDMLLTSLVFSHSGNLIVAGTVDGKILLIDFAELEFLTTLTGHHGAVERLIFSLDGQYLFSGSADGTVRTWGLP
jgi:WD40 repeat protein